MSAQVELWRVSTVEGVFETDLETLKQWIVEGCVLPTDKVSKGSLNWIEAGRVPKLKGAFNGEPVVSAATEPSPAVPVSQTAERFDRAQSFGPSPEDSSPTVQAIHAGAPANVCHNHPETPTIFLCRMCNASLCGDCPKYVGVSN